MGRKRLTKEQFIEKAITVHGNTYNYNNLHYEGVNTKAIITCKVHGDFEQYLANHLAGQGCKKCYNKNRTCTKEEFINKANKIHNDFYDYRNVTYVNTHVIIEIICPLHGKFKQTPHSHLEGSGCSICANQNKRLSQIEFVGRCNIIHDFKYDYSETVYDSARKKIKIICPEHGIFSQMADTHLRGGGCQKCGNFGYKQKDFISKCKNNKATLYVVNLSNHDESFIKIGITSRTVKKRFYNLKKYVVTTILSIEKDPDTIWCLEQLLKKQLKHHQYIPKHKFAGMYECFTLESLDQIKEILKE